ncbi:MAG: outer membrane beta-barrel protein [Acidobacteria bacterium]|nr:outer membrane beta-barrel protein [Acidobacteriota bacterium]
MSLRFSIVPICYLSRRVLLPLFVATLSLTSGVEALAQFDGRKTEVGVQFSLFRQSERPAPVFFRIGPLPPDLYYDPFAFALPSAVGQDVGFGGRVGYNFSNYIAAEGEVNFFPTESQASGGRKTQALFGLKAGGRVDNFGLFAKVRPGLMNFSDIPEGGSDTNFALDVGAVVEYYPSRRTLIRVDLSDVIVQFEEMTFTPVAGTWVFASIADFLLPAPVVSPAPPQPAPVPIPRSFRRPAVTTHNFQLSVGFGLRF